MTTIIAKEVQWPQIKVAPYPVSLSAQQNQPPGKVTISSSIVQFTHDSCKAIQEAELTEGLCSNSESHCLDFPSLPLCCHKL